MLGRARDWEPEGLASGPAQQASCVTPPLRPPPPPLLQKGVRPLTRHVREEGWYAGQSVRE